MNSRGRFVTFNRRKYVSYRHEKVCGFAFGQKPEPEPEQEEAMGNAGSAPEQAKKADGDGAEGGGLPPSTVRFFPSAVQHKARQPPPIKLEEEDVPPPPAAEEDMAPRNLWQVYALGAFILLRWGWVKWKESNDRDDSPDGQSPDGSS